MKTKTIIDRLKAQCTSLGGRVAGAAALAQAMEYAADWTVPAAFVVPLSEETAPNALVGDTQAQNVVIEFGVAALVSNASDEPGFTAAEAVVDLFAEVRAALCGWPDDGSMAPINYVSGQLGDFDRARLWWEWRFSTEELRVEG